MVASSAKMALIAQALCVLMFAPCVAGQSYSFVMNVLNNKFSACYMQLFQQSVNNLAIHNNSETVQLSFSTSLGQLFISSCYSTSIAVSASTGSASFAAALTFDKSLDPTTACLDSIASNSLSLNGKPSGRCGTCTANANYIVSMSSQSSIVCSVTMYTQWGGSGGIGTNAFEIDFYAAENPMAYPASVVMSTPAPEEQPAVSEVVLVEEKKIDIKENTMVVKHPANVGQTSVAYKVAMYVLLADFASCVPSLFEQGVNDLQAQNETTVVYVTFSTSLSLVDVSQCNFNQILISGNTGINVVSTSLVFNDQSDCSTSVASNAMSVHANPGPCDSTQCYCSAYNCPYSFLTGLSTSSASVCNVSLTTNAFGSPTFADQHTYTMLANPTAYPTSFTVSL